MIDINSGAVADAMALGDFSLPASDVRNAESQSALADSLVADDESVRPLESFNFDSAAEERSEEEYGEGEEESDDGGFDPDEVGQRFADEYQHEQILNDAQRQQEEQAPVEVTAQDIAESVQATHEFIAEHQLVDVAETATMVSELGLDPARTESAGQSMALLGITSVQRLENAGWNPENVTPLQRAQAQAVHDVVLSEMFGVDPRLSPVANPQAFGADVMFFVDNLMSTINTLGVNATLQQINNNPAWSMAVCNCLRRHFRNNEPIDRETAVQAADSLSKPLQGFARRLAALRQEAPARSSRSRQVGSRFLTHQDLFDDEGETLYRRGHGRL
jgi:hypothetical protein